MIISFTIVTLFVIKYASIRQYASPMCERKSTDFVFTGDHSSLALETALGLDITLCSIAVMIDPAHRYILL